jgi:hypothetical protein
VDVIEERFDVDLDEVWIGRTLNQPSFAHASAGVVRTAEEATEDAADSGRRCCAADRGSCRSGALRWLDSG